MPNVCPIAAFDERLEPLSLLLAAAHRVGVDAQREDVRSLYPPEIRLHFVLDNFSAHKGEAVREWAQENNVELAYTPHYASWLNRIEAQFRALRYFTLASTDHPDHATQARLIRRYIAWRNRNTDNLRLRTLINTANVA